MIGSGDGIGIVEGHVHQLEVTGCEDVMEVEIEVRSIDLKERGQCPVGSTELSKQ